MANMLIDGVYVSLTAPFSRDGSTYRRKLEHNTGRYSLTPAAGLVALAPGGEGTSLSDEETVETLTTIGHAASSEKVLVAGLERGSVRGALWLAEKAWKAGFDAVLAGAPLHWQQLTNAERILYLKAIADASPLPLLLSSDELPLSIETAAELAHHPNVIGMFDTALTIERYLSLMDATRTVKHEVTVTKVFAPVTRRMNTATDEATFVSAVSLLEGRALVAAAAPSVKTRTKTVGFQVMAAGSAEDLNHLLAAGVPGAMPRLATCAPQAVHEVYAAFKDGDPALSKEKCLRLSEGDALLTELGIAGIKYACDLNGYYGGFPRLPRLALSAEQLLRVEQGMANLKN